MADSSGGGGLPPLSSLPPAHGAGRAPAARPLPLLQGHARGANFAPALWYTVAGQVACLALALGLAALQFRLVTCADLLGAWAAAKGGGGEEGDAPPPAPGAADAERGGGDGGGEGPAAAAVGSSGSPSDVRGGSSAPRGSAASSVAAAAAAAAQAHKSTPLYVALQCP